MVGHNLRSYSFDSHRTNYRSRCRFPIRFHSSTVGSCTQDRKHTEPMRSKLRAVLIGSQSVETVNTAASILASRMSDLHSGFELVPKGRVSKRV